MVSSLFEIVIGFTGLIGFLLRFIGPLTIASTITLVGVALFQSAADEAGRLTVKSHFCSLDFWFLSLVNLIDLLISHLYRYTLGNCDDVSILCPGPATIHPLWYYEFDSISSENLIVSIFLIRRKNLVEVTNVIRDRLQL